MTPGSAASAREEAHPDGGASIAAAPCVTQTPKDAPVDAGAPFDAAAAWDEFEKTVRESYAYLDRRDFSVDAQLAHSKALALAAKDFPALREVLHRTTFAFTDPHFLVAELSDDDPNVFPTSSDLVVTAYSVEYMANVEHVAAGVEYVVDDVRAGSAADLAGVRPGFRVVTVNDEPIERAIESIWGGVVLARTQRQRTYAATLAVNGRRGGTRTVAFDVFKTGKLDERKTLTLENPRAFARRVAERAPITVETRDGVGILRFENSLGKNETIRAIDAAIEQVLEAPAIIVDLRNTPSGGNTDVARALIGHFISEARPYQMHEIPAVLRSTTVPRRFVEYALPRAPRYKGRLVVLGGHWTGSMGEGLVIGLHAAAHARAFVSDMGDLLGALHTFQMERSPAVVELGAESLFHVDGTPRAEFRGDVPLAQADRDEEGRDPAMRAALAWLASAPKHR